MILVNGILTCVCTVSEWVENISSYSIRVPCYLKMSTNLVKIPHHMRHFIEYNMFLRLTVLLTKISQASVHWWSGGNVYGRHKLSTVTSAFIKRCKRLSEEVCVSTVLRSRCSLREERREKTNISLLENSGAGFVLKTSTMRQHLVKEKSKQDQVVASSD